MKRKALSALSVILAVMLMLLLGSCGARDFEGVSFEDATFMYDGFEHSISVSGLPDKAQVSYSPSNTQTEAGKHIITATISAKRYNTLVLTATLNIVHPDDYALDTDIAEVIEMLNKAMAEMKKESEDKIEALKSEYQARIDALEEENKATDSALGALATEYNQRVELLTAADKQVNEELNALKKIYSENRDELLGADADLRSRLQSLRNDYESRLGALELSGSAGASEIKKLKAEYETKISELRGSISESNSKIEKLTADYEKALADIDAESESREAEIAALRKDYDEKLEALRSSIEAAEAEIDTLTEEHGKRLGDLESEQKRIEEDIRALTEEYNKTADTLGQDIDGIKEQLKKLEEDYEKKLQPLTEAIAANKKALDELADEYESSVENLEGQIETNSAAILQNYTNLQTIIDKTEGNCQTRVDNLKSSISTLQSNNANAFKRIEALEKALTELIKLNVKPTHTVKFDSDGGVGEIPDQTVSHGEKAKAPATPTRAGYSFLGWFVGDEKWSFIGYSVTEDIVLTAKWTSTEIRPTKVGYTLVDGVLRGSEVYGKESVSILDAIEIDEGCRATLFEDISLSRELPYCRMTGLSVGENFAYLLIEDEGGKQKIYKVIITLTKDVCFYAGGELYATVPVVDGMIPAPDGAPEGESGYEFDFWRVNGIRASFPYPFAEEVSFEAVFKPTVYTITYDTDEGIMPEGYPGSYTILDSLTLPVPTRALYTFGGWYRTEALTGDDVTEIKVGSTGNLTFYAKWIPIEDPDEPENPPVDPPVVEPEEPPIGDNEGTEGIIYESNGDGFTVSGYNGADTEVVIPSTYDGLPVTAIADRAFKDNTLITSLFIPGSVKTIGANALRGCTSLSDVTISEGVESIGQYAFSGCSTLTKITIPDSVTAMGKYTLQSCDTLTELVLGDGITEIPANFVSGCKNLTKITIPEGVVTIASYAFTNSYVKEIVIPSSITSIEAGAFNGCSTLTDVYYRGSEEKWSAVTISQSGNAALNNATKHFNYEK